MTAPFSRVAGLVRGRAGLLLLAALCAAGLLLALGLDSSGSTNSLYDQGTPAAKATASYHRQFGDEPIQVLIQGRRSQGGLPALLLTEDLNRILGLEGCLSGNLPSKAKAPAPACAALARTKPIQVVSGPGTFINESARQVATALAGQRAGGVREAEQAATAARKVAAAQGKSSAEQERLARAARTLSLAQSYRNALALALRYGLPRVPQLNDPDFVLKLVFEPSLGFDTPKPRFAYLFPTSTTALIQARPRPGLSRSQQRNAIALVRQAVGSKPFRLKRASYLVSGQPVVTEAVASSLTDSLWPLLAIAILGAALGLLLATRLRRPALPVGAFVAALASLPVVMGLMSLTGASLTLASIAIPPVVVGFACACGMWSRAAAEHSRRVALVGAAGVVAFLALVASPVPMVRTFGVFTAVGIAIAIVLGARLAATSRPRRSGDYANTRRAARGRGRAFFHRARDMSGWGWALRTAVRRPALVLATAFVIALVGWLVSFRTDVSATPERLAPSGIGAVKDEKKLVRETGFAGTVAVTVKSDALTTPTVLKWMSGYQQRILARHGYSDRRLCSSADLCPALSLTTLVGTGRSSRQVRTVLRQLPPYFSRSVVSADRKTGGMSFTVRDMPLRDQRRLIDDMRAQLDPPAGVRAEIAGLPALAADTEGQLVVNWLALSLVVLAALFLVAFALGVRGQDALVPLVAAALSSGWSALVLYLLPFPLSPMSAAIVAVAVALAGAGALVHSAAYRRRRTEGIEQRDALAAASAELGTLAWPLAPALAGLAALLVSNVPMLRDLGVAGLIDIPLTALAMAIVLPASIVTAERRSGLRLPRSRGEANRAARRLAGGARVGVAAAGRGLRALPAAARRAGGDLRRRRQAQRP